MGNQEIHSSHVNYRCWAPFLAPGPGSLAKLPGRWRVRAGAGSLESLAGRDPGAFFQNKAKQTNKNRTWILDISIACLDQGRAPRQGGGSWDRAVQEAMCQMGLRLGGPFKAQLHEVSSLQLTYGACALQRNSHELTQN